MNRVLHHNSVKTTIPVTSLTNIFVTLMLSRTAAISRRGETYRLPTVWFRGSKFKFLIHKVYAKLCVVDLILGIEK